MKVCKKCGVEKDECEFYKNKKWRLTTCKSCCKKYVKELSEIKKLKNNITKRKYQKKYKKSEKGKIVQSRYYKSKSKKLASIRWINNLLNKIKIQAQRKVHYAVKIGYLIKKPCEICNNIISQAHHPDYNKPLDIIWLCNYHHSMVHQGKLKLNLK